MTRDELFNVNAGIVRDLVTGVANYCPKAFVLIISNPVNSTVPIACEILKAHNVFDARRVFGVTTLDVVRASTSLHRSSAKWTQENLQSPLLVVTVVRQLCHY
jgi:malate dehydrogenase